MVPYAYDDQNPNIIHVAMSDPMDMIALDDVSIITNLQPEPAVSTAHDILLTLDKYFGDTEAQKMAEVYAAERKEQLAKNQEDESYDMDVSSSPVVLLVNSMIEQAARQRASDIHIEALERTVRVRFRIDGALYEKYKYDIHLLPAIIARLKIIGGMDISEKRKPQDGRITLVVDRIEYDIRVSILPTVYGEKCVMRLAQKKALTRNKKDLGLNPDDLRAFDNILKNPNGILLVTGPTGSGKSTTLYTALSELNTEDVNIITVEDPVEANIDGINQVQVNPKADLTFASALRSILRQDPDIIMIGEIRDGETASIAVQASITGHLVVSTLHTNSAAATLSRLEDMGIESYLLADSMVGIIAQRLVRRLCPNCKRPHIVTDEEKKVMSIDDDGEITIYEAAGCDKCDNTGYTGRIGIYEIMTITQTIRDMINRHSSAIEIQKAAQKEGMHTLRESATKLVLEGTTSYKEMLRTTFENTKVE
jgi:type IV pilus assembly protein PilB